ncbi:MAG: bifunctional diaminohydroxyphosphoribosylaminopyrimidine deaminase/5-amino-6-(5-phosphoribosylamino)uracil reductase RibD [bacterium]
MSGVESTLPVNDESFMSEAIRLAASVPSRPWPNPPVGAVVVKDGRVIGRGAHHGPGSSHAEIVALAEAGAAAEGATLYCSLEPCNHLGNTPPCAPAVAASGVRRVVFGVRDPNPTVTGNGARLLVQRGIDVTCGVLGRAALELIWPFVVTDAFQRPFVLLKTATSLDGRFWTDPARMRQASGGPVYLTSEPSLRDAHCWRRWSDLVLIGETTLKVDRPRLDGRLVDGTCHCPTDDPAVGYVDSDLSHGDGWHHNRYQVFCGESVGDQSTLDALRSDGASVNPCAVRDGHVDPRSLVAVARAAGFYYLMIEGGPHLAASFLAAGLVDRWLQYRAPVAVGSGVQWPEQPLVAPEYFELTGTERLGPDLRLVYDRPGYEDRLTAMTGPVTEELR